MNLLFHSWEFPPNGMGVGSYVREMSEALTRAGHRCIIATGYARGYPHEEETPCGRVIRFYSKTEIRSHGVTRKVLDLARKHSVDLIEGADHLGECTPILKTRHRPPVAIKVHSSHALKVLVKSQVYYTWQYATIGIALALRWKQIMAEWQSLVHADALIAPSNRIVHELIRQGLPGAERCKVIPNPVIPVESVTPPEANLPTALFVGRLDIGKGIEFLPGIMKTVWREIPNARLEIAGPDGYARGIGSLKRWLLEKFGSNADRVDFLGNQDPEGLSSAYRRAWVVVVPSRWDNFPGVVLEAMTNARAIVASPHGGMPEMLNGTDCVIAGPDTDLFPEAVCRFLTDPSKGFVTGMSARQKAIKEYHPAKIAQEYVELMKPICRSRSRG